MPEINTKPMKFWNEEKEFFWRAQKRENITFFCSFSSHTADAGALLLQALKELKWFAVSLLLGWNDEWTKNGIETVWDWFNNIDRSACLVILNYFNSISIVRIYVSSISSICQTSQIFLFELHSVFTTSPMCFYSFLLSPELSNVLRILFEIVEFIA